MSDYLREFDFSDPQVAKMFVDVIKEIVQKEIVNLKFNRMYPATVVGTGSGTADIQLMGSTTTISGVKVRDGLTVINGDEIYVTAINGSLNNMFVDVKK